MGFENMPEVMTVKELAEILKLSDQTIARAIKNKELEAFKVGRNVRISKDAVMKWIKR